MGESEIQPLIALICRCGQIVQFLLLSHAVPSPVSIAIPLDIIHLCPQVQQDVDEQQEQKNTIASFVSRRVILLVDVRGDDAAGLDTHIV